MTFDRLPTSRAAFRAQVRAAMTLTRDVVKIGSAEEKARAASLDAAIERDRERRDAELRASRDWAALRRLARHRK